MSIDKKQHPEQSVHEQPNDPDATDVSPYIPRRSNDKNLVEIKKTKQGGARKWPFRHDDITNGVATLGPYTLLGVLGGGGTSSVFAAKDPDDQRFAIKMLHGDQTLKEPAAIQRFRQEFQIMDELNHANIATVHEIGFTQNNAYIVMEKLSNHDLRYRASSGLDRDTKFLYARQILSAMIYMGNNSIIHRDLKPSNILFRDDDTAVVTDFGAAKRIDQSIDLGITSAGIVVGTLTYSSPEQIKSDTLDLRSDQYSFGVLLYELLADRRIFDGHKAEDVAHKHLHEDPETLPEEYEFLQPVLDRLLAKDPEKRFSCSEEARDTFEGYIELYS